jgi:hypothetical protein
MLTIHEIFNPPNEVTSGRVNLRSWTTQGCKEIYTAVDQDQRGNDEPVGKAKANCLYMIG